MSQLPLIYRRADGRLGANVLRQDGKEEEIVLQVVRCFPWSTPDSYISLRDDQGKEVYLLSSLYELEDPKIRHLVETELHDRTYIPRILHINAIVDEIDLFRWNVKTDAGNRLFYTRRREIPRETKHGGVIVKDISGDRYLIPAVSKLDAKSRNWLWLYLD